MAIFEKKIGGTKHFKVCGNQPTWVELIHKTKSCIGKKIHPLHRE